MKKPFTGVFVLLFSLCIGLFWALPSSAATFTVNSTLDTSDGTCIDPFVDAASDCTLREAIDAANAAVANDDINFNISTANFVDDGDGQFLIKISSALPVITGGVTISAAGQWDSDDSRPGIRVVGNDAGANVVGFDVNTGLTEIQGLTISGFSGSQIELTGDSNIIGTDCDTSSDAAEHVNIINGASEGIYINTGSDSNIISGVYIGLNESGTADAGNNTTGIYIGGDNNKVGFNLNGCDESIWRTVVSGNGSDGIKIRGDNNKIQGDYIGLNSAGTIAIPNDDSGIDIQDNSSDNIIGTDGNGVNDSLEGNVISGNAASGISITETIGQDAAGGPDENRISGNIIGLNSTQAATIANGEHGILIAADDIIVGWCDTTVSATLCDNGGTQADQANTIFTNSSASDGIHLGVRADEGVMFGNYIGITSSGNDPGNVGGQGVAVEKRNGAHLIGGTTAEMRNIIAHFDNGVRVYITTADSESPAENITISGNIISNNESGVRCDETLEFSSGTYTYENTLSNNTISNNTENGVRLSGCSWDIQSNEITDNGSWGIYVVGRERPDDPAADELSPGDVTGSNYNNPFDGPSPNNSLNDLISRPRIQSNSVSGNTSGGMYFLEASATNASSLLGDNTFASNNNQNHIEQAWYGAVEILDSDNNAITSGSETVTLVPNAGSCSNCSGTTVDTDSVSGNTIWGKAGLDYNDAETWFTVSDYAISSTGAKTAYNPYTITVDGDVANHGGIEYTFDGADNDTASQGGAPNGITTNGIYRYQIAEVETSSRPDRPTNISPADGSTGVSLTPTLIGSTFSDSAETHARTSWRIYSSSTNCTAGGPGNIYDLSTTSDLTQTTVPSGELSSATTYYWVVSYSNDFGNFSAPSACTSFTTIQTVPTFTGTIDDQTWNEDETVTTAFDLDEYFSDEEGETLTYTINNSEADNITISISANNVVSFTSDIDWNGAADITITACDTDGECVSSNAFTATVTSVNDAPTAPDSGFSPADSDVTSDTTPRISWDAASDPDHTTSELHYAIRLGTNPDPVTEYSYSATTSADRTSHTVTEALIDDTTYYYVIRTIDPAEAKSDWSEVQTFAVNSEVAPEITLTKEVDRVDEVSQVIHNIEKVLAKVFLLPIPLPVHGAGAETLFTLVQIMLHTLLWLSVLGIGLLLIALLAMGRSWRDIGHLITSKPSRAFERIHQVKADAVHKVSFHVFKNRLIALRSVLTISVLVFFSMVTANATEAPIILQSTIQALAETIVVEPDNTIAVTVSYENTGDGSATSSVFTDTIPSDTSYVAGTLTVNDETQSDSAISGSALTLAADTITSASNTTNSSGTITYQLEIDNPYSGSSLFLPAASLTANELETAAESNSLTLSVSSASVSGEVTTTAGNGIRGVTVLIYQGAVLVSTTTTNSNGQYSLSGLGDGTYTVEVVAPTGYLTPDSQALTVSAGTAYTGIDFTLVRSSTGDSPPDETDEPDTDQDSTDTDDSTDDNDTIDTDDTDDTEDTNDALEDILLDLRVPEELLDDFTDIDLPSEDEAQRIQELTEQLEIITVNDQTDDVLILDSSDTALGSLIDDIGELLFPGSNDITLEGVGPPNAKITVSICYVISETSTDSEGKWVMVIPESVLQPGENVFYATAEKDGVVSEQVEVARVVVDQPSLISRTALLAYLSVLIVIITLNVTGYIVLVRRQRRFGIKPHTQFWAWTTLLCVLLSIGALIGSFAAQQWRTYDLSAEARQIQEGITMETVNDTELPPGQDADFSDASMVHFSGAAPADTNLAITLCDNQPFRTTTATQDGTWDMFVPVDLLPTARFTISAQGVAGDWLGDPHRLVDLDIVARNLLLQVNILLTIAYVLLFISAATLWWHSQVNTVPRSKLGTKKTNPTLNEEL